MEWRVREEVHEVEGWNGKVRWSALLWRRNGGRGRRGRGETREYLMKVEFVEDDYDDDDI